MVAYLDGELALDAARELKEHLEKCSLCAEGLEGFRSVRASLRAVPRLKVSDAFRSALGEQLASLHYEERVRAPERSWFRRKIVYFAPSLAACAAFLFVAHFWVLDYVRGGEDIHVVSRGESRRQMLLELPAEAIFESMITGSELDVSKWLSDGALYLRGYDDVYSADRCIFAFLPADWGAQDDKRDGVRVVVANGRFHVPEDMRAHYLDGARRVTVLRHALVRQLKIKHSEIWNTERLRRFLSTPVDIHIRAGSSS
jgi:hypothetical protein